MKKVLSAIIVVIMAMGLTSCGYEDKQAQANANAHMIFSAFNGAFEDNPNVSISYSIYEGSFKDGMVICIDGVNDIDMSAYLGNSYDGFFRIYVDPQYRCVTAALWSEDVINPVFVSDQMLVSDLINYYDVMGTAVGSWPYYEG